jgi:hypothetical protein
MTFLAFTGILNVAICGSLAFFVLHEKPRSPIARNYGLFNLAIVFWSSAYTVWQFMGMPQHAYIALQWTLFFGLWPNIAFLYFVFCIEGMNRRRWLFLIGFILLTVCFAWMDLSGVLFTSVGPRPATGLWGNPTKWFGAFIFFWSLECLVAFLVFLQIVQRSDVELRNRMYYVFFALVIGHIGAICNWPMWYGIHFPTQLNLLVSVCSCILG